MSLDQSLEKTKQWLDSLPELSSLTEKLSLSNEEPNRLSLIATALQLLEDIQAGAYQAAEKNAEELKSLVNISLHDMKTFNALLRFIILQGIYPGLDSNAAIPLHLRSKTPVSTANGTSTPLSPSQKCTLLTFIVSRIVRILDKPGDVRDLLLLGTYHSDFLIAASHVAFHPQWIPEDRKQAIEWYEKIKGAMDTFDLFRAYTSLLRKDSPKWLRNVLARQLALLPLSRQNGVKSLIEFVTGIREKDNPSLEDLDRAVEVLSKPPRGVQDSVYNDKVARQLLTILYSKGSNDLKSATVYIINSLAESLPSLTQHLMHLILEPFQRPSDETQVDSSLAAIISLVKTPGPSIISGLLDSAVIPLWILCAFTRRTKKQSQVIAEILTVAMATVEQPLKYYKLILSNLLQESFDGLVYGSGPQGGVEVRMDTGEMTVSDVLQEVETRGELFTKLLENAEDSVISSLVVVVIKDWLSSSSKSMYEQDEDPFKALTNAKVLQSLVDTHKEKIFKSPSEIVQVISTVIMDFTSVLGQGSLSNKQQSVDLRFIDGASGHDDADSDDEPDDDEEQMEIVGVCISLVSGIVLDAGLSSEDRTQLLALSSHLRTIRDNCPPLHDKAEAALDIMSMTDDSQGQQEEKVEDSSAEVLRKALAYLQDPVVPVRAQGLYLLRTLIQAKDPVIKVESALKVLINQLKDEDSFVHLNAVKTLELLSEVYARQQVTEVLVGFYLDPDVDVDDRLRAGEVLLRIVQRSAKGKGDMNNLVVEALISVVTVEKDKKDDRLRMSAMSIIGAVCELNPMSLTSTNLIDCVDLAIGVLTFETKTEQNIMRRSAVHMIYSLVEGLDAATVPDIPAKTVQLIVTRLEAAKVDEDPIVRDNAHKALELIQGIIS
uniref:ARAD1C15114p n=1 Tax=Blastobotrys adeninivorans TaxID=409370 RepID=A0A060T0R7_BLAAD